MNISNLFLNAAEKYPEQIAIIDKKNSIDYYQLKQDVLKTSAYYQKMGIQKGDRVLVFVPMSVDLYRIVLALFHCGATAVFLDEWVSKKRMELCCEIADCKGFIGIFKARVFALFSRELRKIPVKLKVHGKLNTLGDIADVDENESALITFTTGSTGRPKAADRTHGFLKEQFNALLDEIEPKVKDVDMPVLPIVLFMNLGVGCTSVIADFKMSKPEKMDVDSIVGSIKTNSVNRITSSPFFITKLTEKHNTHASTFLQIEKIFTGGAPVFPQQAETYKKSFPNTEVNIVYGSTEAEPISSIRASDLVARKNELSKGLPVGKCYHKADIRIIQFKDEAIPSATAEEFTSLICDEGVTGEIIVSGAHVLKKYYNNEEAFRANKIIVGETIWHRTGDSGHFNRGELFLTGRCKQLIEWEGDLISPFVIENQLQTIEGVEMGTLLKVKNQLVIVLETKQSKENLEKVLVNIPHDKIECIDIPRDPRHNSKIDYDKLLLILQQG